MLISNLHSSIVIGCGRELNQSDCLYVGQKGTEGVGSMEGTEGAEAAEAFLRGGGEKLGFYVN